VDEPISGSARFDELLAGIAEEVAAADAAALDADIAEVERAARAETRILDRMRAQREIRLELGGGTLVTGFVAAVGRDCVVLSASDGDWVVPVWGMSAVIDLGDRGREAVSVSDRLGLASVARAWARQRCVVRILRLDAGSLDGTIDSVGADYLDLAEHDPGEPRRPEAVRRRATVPLAAVAAIRRR
jgi:hypothetical protein